MPRGTGGLFLLRQRYFTQEPGTLIWVLSCVLVAAKAVMLSDNATSAAVATIAAFFMAFLPRVVR